MGDIINDIKSRISLLKNRKEKDTINNGMKKTADDISDMQINRALLNKFKEKKSFTDNTNTSEMNGKTGSSKPNASTSNEGNSEMKTQKRSNLLLELKNSFGLANINTSTANEGENGKKTHNIKVESIQPEGNDKLAIAQDNANKIKEANIIHAPVHESKQMIPETKKRECDKIGLIITEYKSNSKYDSKYYPKKEKSVEPSPKVFTAPQNHFGAIKKLNLKTKYDLVPINLDNQSSDQRNWRRESPFARSIKDRLNDISSSMEKDRLRMNQNKNISIQDIYIPPTHSKAVIDLTAEISKERCYKQAKDLLAIYKIEEIKDLSSKLKIMSSSTFKQLDAGYVSELKTLYNVISSLLSNNKI